MHVVIFGVPSRTSTFLQTDSLYSRPTLKIHQQGSGTHFNKGFEREKIKEDLPALITALLQCVVDCCSKTCGSEDSRHVTAFILA